MSMAFPIWTPTTATTANLVLTCVLTTSFSAGDYLLTVSTGNGQSQNDEYDLTIGSPDMVQVTAVGNLNATAIFPAGKTVLFGFAIQQTANHVISSTRPVFAACTYPGSHVLSGQRRRSRWG